MTDLPFVTAVCITGKDDFSVNNFLPQAMKCFADQTYPKNLRRLLVVWGCDCEADYFDMDLGGEGTKFLEVPLIGMPLANLRNIGLECCDRGLVIQWDCDDWHHPARIAAQVEAYLALEANTERASRPLAVCLHRQLCYSFENNTAFVRSTGDFLHGTILHPITDARYPSGMRKEEDSVFIEHFDCYGVDLDPAMYVRFEHGHNTWDAAHILQGYDGNWAKGQWHLGDNHRQFLRSVLTEYADMEPGDIPRIPAPEAVA